MLVRRMLMLAAVLMAITAITVALAPRNAAQEERAGPAATATPTPAAEEPGAPARSPVERDGVAPGEPAVKTMQAEDSGQVVRVAAGDVLRLRVVSEELETVQLGTDGPIDVADRDSPAEFDVLAEPGDEREVRLLESGRTIGRLVTQP